VDAGDTNALAPDTSLDGPVDAPLDAPVPLPEGAAPVSWAQTPMPNPPDAGPNPFKYVANADGSVTDTVTGLVWLLPERDSQVADESGFQAALEQCASVPQDAGAHWRLPTRIELVTLIDFSQQGTAADPTFFVTLQGGWYWTSSVVRPVTLPYRFWAVNFFTGEVSPSVDPQKRRGVLCVKGT
jgi:hypothetical protein